MKKALIFAAAVSERERLKNMLLELGFAEILESNDLKKAEQLAFDSEPEVVIIEISEQKSIWLDVVKAISGRFRVPCILFGSSISVDDIEKGIAAGGGGFLIKPLRKEELWSAIEIAVLHNHELAELKEKVATLEGALESRKSVERAKGVLMRVNAMSEPEAFRRMQKLAMDRRTTLLKIAEAILLTEGVAEPPASK